MGVTGEAARARAEKERPLSCALPQNQTSVLSPFPNGIAEATGSTPVGYTRISPENTEGGDPGVVPYYGFT